jgi:hypothetical protein
VKYKGKQGNKYIFDGGYDKGELKLIECYSSDFLKFKSDKGKVLYIDKHLNVKHDPMDYIYYKDIQTAVNLMEILIKEGLFQ